MATFTPRTLAKAEIEIHGVTHTLWLREALPSHYLVYWSDDVPLLTGILSCEFDSKLPAYQKFAAEIAAVDSVLVSAE